MVKLNLTSALIADRDGNTSTLAHSVFDRYGLCPEFIIDIAASLQRDPEKLAELLTEFSFKHKKPESTRPAYSALNIGGSYMLGGLVPLILFFCVRRTKVLLALYWSICTMVGAPFAFGWTKTAIHHWSLEREVEVLEQCQSSNLDGANRCSGGGSCSGLDSCSQPWSRHVIRHFLQALLMDRIRKYPIR